MTTKKNKYRVEAVPYGKNIKTYARQLEEIANKLEDEGYRFQLNDQKMGTVLFAQLAVPSVQEALADLLAPPTVNTEHFAPRTRDLVAQFFAACGEHHNEPEAFLAAAQKKAPTLLKGFTVSDLNAAAGEIDMEAEAHLASHSGTREEECQVPALLRHVARVVREHLQRHLQ